MRGPAKRAAGPARTSERAPTTWDEAEAHGGLGERAAPLRRGGALTPASAMQLQRTIGNRAVMKVGRANDALEREAERAAERAVDGHDALPRPRGEPRVQRRSSGAFTGSAVPAGVAAAIEDARTGGQPLAGSVRGPMERAFGADFGGVRVHTGPRAEGLNRSLAARAFTTGRDIFVGAGGLDPATRSGRHLLAHELAHVVQQGPSSRVIQRLDLRFWRDPQPIDHPDWHAEAEAYEQRLGTYCYHHPRARRAMGRGLGRMLEVLTTYFTPAGKTSRDIAEAFFKDDVSSAGQIGTDQAEEKLEVLFGQGNLREQMTAFYNAAYYKAGYGADLGVSFKAILHDITMDSPSFDERASDELGLSTPDLRAQSEFLRGKARRRIKGGLSKLKPDKKYTFSRDIFALGNLYYQHSLGALKDMTVSQRDRVDRSPDEKMGGVQKKTARAYAEMLAPLSEREKAFLRARGQPYQASEVGLSVNRVAGTYRHPNGDVVTLDANGDPGWRDVYEVTVVDGKLHCTFGAVDADLGTRQEIVVVRSALDNRIERIRWRHLVLRRAASQLGDDQLGAELPLDWIEGTAWFKFREGSAWYDKVHRRLGMPVVAGVSGTTTRMLLAYNWLNVEGVNPLDFRLALMGWMLTSWDHSLYEILSGARYAGVERGTERLDDAVEMYQHIPPLTRAELRSHVCKDGLFPHEIVLARMAEEA